MSDVSLFYPLDKKLVESLDNYIVELRENNGEDMMAARLLLKENRDDVILLEYCLTASAICGLWKKTPDGKKGEPIPLLKVENAKDLLKFAKMLSLNQWNELNRINSEFNKLLTPNNLEK